MTNSPCVDGPPRTGGCRALEASQFHVADAAASRMRSRSFTSIGPGAAYFDSADRGLLELEPRSAAGRPAQRDEGTIKKVEGLWAEPVPILCIPAVLMTRSPMPKS